MKALYCHKQSGDIFAIEIDVHGHVLSTAGPLLFKNLNPDKLDYDNYFSAEIKAKIIDFERLTREDYFCLLRKNGFIIQQTQHSFF